MRDWRAPHTPWTVEDISEAARIAAARTVGGTILGSDKRVTAWEGVALHVAEHPESCWSDAVEAGALLVRRDTDRVVRDRTDDEAPPRFLAWWMRRDLVNPDPMGDRVERWAFWQVWDTLTDAERETIITRAAAGSNGRAAAAVGVSHAWFSTRMRRARAVFFAGLFDWETPPDHTQIQALKQSRTACRHGHPWAGNEQWVWVRGRRQRRCAECGRISARKAIAKRRRAA